MKASILAISTSISNVLFLIALKSTTEINDITVSGLTMPSTLKKIPISSTKIDKRLSLGGSKLCNIAKESSKLDQESSSLDMNGVLWLEHINLVVGKNDIAEYFYQDILGLSRDKDAKFHVNLGQQQFHLAQVVSKNDEHAQRIHGSVGLVVPNLKAVRDRIYKHLNNNKDGSETEMNIHVLEDKYDEEGYMSITCPWGNIFHLYCAKYDDTKSLVEDASIPKKMVRAHKSGGKYSADRLSIRGQPGIRYIELLCPKGSTASIHHFYKSIIGCNVNDFITPDNKEEARHALSVSVGPGVHLLFVEEVEESNDGYSDKRALMEGVHICIYVQHFKLLCKYFL